VKEKKRKEKEKKRITSIQPRGHDEMLTDK
jgi:hypothetical protein